MVTKIEQLKEFNELQRKNMEAAMKLAQLSIDNSQRIMELQSNLAKKMFEDSVANAKAQSAAKDPQEVMKLRTEYAQATAQKMMEAAKAMAEIGNASRLEFSAMLTEQLKIGKTDIAEAFQTYLKAMPGQGTKEFEKMKESMASITGAFEQITKSSTAAFSNMATPAKKAASSKKK